MKMRFSEVFCVCGLLSVCNGHGAMSFPKTRNIVTDLTCPTCANGPTSVCGAGGQWLADGKAADQLNSALTTPLTQLVSGGMVDVEVYFTACHKGHMVVELCANPGSTITDDCFVRLERDPKDTRYSPYVKDTSTLFYMPDDSCATSFVKSSPMKARFIVPKGVKSDHAVLRWFWQTGNSCDSAKNNGQSWNSSPAQEISDWKGTIGGRSCSASVGTIGISCGDDCPNAKCAGEQFKNCADVSVVAGDANTVVTSDGASVGPSPTSDPSNPTKAPKPPKSTTPKDDEGDDDESVDEWEGKEKCMDAMDAVAALWDANCKESYPKQVNDCMVAFDDVYYTWVQNCVDYYCEVCE